MNGPRKLWRIPVLAQGKTTMGTTKIKRGWRTSLLNEMPKVAKSRER